MYEVSEAYLAALREKAVKDSISGSIILTDGTEIEIDDSVLVKNSLKITKELCSENYRIGTFNLGCLKMTVYDDNALGRDYSGAKISLNYKLFTGEDFSASEEVPLGIFTVDGQSVVRRRNRVSLIAYDNGYSFDIEPSESLRSSTYTVSTLVQSVCGYCGVDFGGIADGLPNSGVTVSLSDGQLQTCRDIIMWAAALMCGYAVIGRDGRLYIISAKYEVSAENSSETIIDRSITESERSSIYSTDTRAYIKYLSAYCGGKVKEYVSDYISEDEQAAAAVYALAKNPLLSEKTESECDTINGAWLSYIDAFKQRGVNAEIYGDPAIDLGDTIRFSGGDIDQRRSIVGVVTAIEWRYRDFQKIICTAAQCGESFGSSSSCTPCASKSQTQKRIDGIKTGSSVGQSEGGGEIFNIYEGFLKNRITDSYAAHAEGNNNSISNSENSHAEGQDNSIISARAAHVGGYGSYVRYGADCGFAHGIGAEVSGCPATAFGTGTLAAGDNQLVAGKFNIEDSEDKYALIIGNGSGTRRGTVDFAPSNALTLDWEGNLWVAGKIQAEGGGTSGEAYIPGDGIDITDTLISLKPATTSAIGGVKAGEGLEVSSDGTLSVKGGGGSYTPGDGIEITDENAINLKQATGTEIGGIILGEGLEYDEATGKTNTIPNIQQAVIIQEKDAAYLLHEYTLVDYIAGNKICYAGAGNQIICNGYIFTKNDSSIPSGYAKLENMPRYQEMTFNHLFWSGGSVDNYPFRIEVVKVDSSGSTDIRFYFSSNYHESYTYDMDLTGWLPTWNAIYPPTEQYPNGYVDFRIYETHTDSTRKLQLTGNSVYGNITFASPAEYNAAVGLTYEPNVLKQVNETITEA